MPFVFLCAPLYPHSTQFSSTCMYRSGAFCPASRAFPGHQNGMPEVLGLAVCTPVPWILAHRLP